MRDSIHAENEGVAIPVRVQWLVNPISSRNRSHWWEVSALSVVLVMPGNKVVRRLVNEYLKEAGV